MALGYVSGQTIWDAKPIVAAIESIFWWARIIYNLALWDTFSVQLPSVRHASSKAVVRRKSMCPYILTVRSIIQQPKGKQYRNRKGWIAKLCKSCGRGKFVNTCQKSVPKSSSWSLITKRPLFDFAPIKLLFHLFKTSIYSKKCCLQQKHVVSSDIFCIKT